MTSPTRGRVSTSAARFFFFVLLVVLLMALAREDRVTVDALAALHQRAWPQSHAAMSIARNMFAVYLADDATCFDLDGLTRSPYLADWVVLYFIEHDLPAPGALMAAARERGLRPHLGEALAEVVEALILGDTVRLAVAIDAAEAQHLVVHAARMRIVLAQRTGDHAPLEQARPVLERLGDWQFLRRLEEVQGALT
jgi:hypothetical protein